MRFVFGCLARRAPEYLEERTYLTTYEVFPDFGLALDVTRRLPERRDDGSRVR